MPASTTLSFRNHWDHFLARWGYRRNDHRVTPGLYAVGTPTPDSPVFVTANYTLSFDALRTALHGIDGTIMVLDTYGVNVWCAAGKGTFGTDELVNRINLSNLKHIVNHRRLILPQLGAPSISPVEVKKQTGFSVEYGPVRADDLPTYLETRKASPAMRKVRFNLWDRMVLIPMEVVHTFIPMILISVILYFLSGLVPALALVTAILAGAALFPILLPVLPTRDFSSKGFLLGGLAIVPFVIAMMVANGGTSLWLRSVGALAMALAIPPVTAYLALNFTGATTFTSKSGVKREMATYIPVMAWMCGAGVVLMLVNIILRWVL
ncbi:MAG: carbon monoxide dehydrogenase [Anaerolineales bacterium]|nr:MAG: carbon monoxide dehydrogenase [Anaerolineales bacterium]